MRVSNPEQSFGPRPLPYQGVERGEQRPRRNPKGRPGVGDAFMKWVWETRFKLRYCEQVAIHARPNPRGEDFDEFREDGALAGFGHADRKFAAGRSRARRNRP